MRTYFNFSIVSFCLFDIFGLSFINSGGGANFGGGGGGGGGTVKALNEIIKNLKNKSGPDDISVKIIKDSFVSIGDTLLDIINTFVEDICKSSR
jgi:hypothetical protein